MPTTRSQQQALGVPIDMPENPPNTLASGAAHMPGTPNIPEDVSVAAEYVVAAELPADPMMRAVQRSLDRISERLEDMHGRLQTVEQRDARVEDLQNENDAPDRPRTPQVANSQPLHSTPAVRSNVLPPHMRTGTTRVASSSGPVAKDPPRAREIFRSLSTPHKDIFRMVLEKMGTSIFEFLDSVPDDAIPEQVVPSGDVGEVGELGAIVVEGGDSSTPSLAAPRLRICKPEYLPEYGGDPYKLDRFLTRVHDIIRNDPDPAWERAVLHALPIKLVGDAEEWHSGLSNEENKAIASFDDLEDAMRLQFPMNRAEQRRLARERKWVPTVENAGTYYFAKLRMLRSAFGKNQTDAVLAQDIVDGLPATFRALIRLARTNVRLIDLRAEIGDWEPTWREMHPQFARRTSSSPSTSQPATVPSPVKNVAAKPAQTAVSPVANPSASNAPRPPPFATTYDPTRVIPLRMASLAATVAPEMM
ncbi:hypothetical protein CF319_g3712 [Tilletia indica]|nr:hypothetical protein CF319_g3712 [Tilletia indica]